MNFLFMTILLIKRKNTDFNISFAYQIFIFEILFVNKSMTAINPKIEESWKILLSDEFNKNYFTELNDEQNETIIEVIDLIDDKIIDLES